MRTWRLTVQSWQLSMLFAIGSLLGLWSCWPWHRNTFWAAFWGTLFLVNSGAVVLNAVINAVQSRMVVKLAEEFTLDAAIQRRGRE